jgi:hypothetical protein
MLADKYTMVAATHKDPEYDVFFFVTSLNESAGNMHKYQSIMWLDRPSKFGDGKLVADYKSKTRLERNYNWKKQATADAQSRAMAQLFQVIFNRGKDLSQDFALDMIVHFLKSA